MERNSSVSNRSAMLSPTSETGGQCANGLRVIALVEPHPDGSLFEVNGVRHLQRWGTGDLEPLPIARSDPRDPGQTKTGIFRDHRCWKCNDGAKPCANGSPSRCDYPRARND
jgi:hypothetical protein